MSRTAQRFRRAAPSRKCDLHRPAGRGMLGHAADCKRSATIRTELRDMQIFMEILDINKPDWWIVFATQQELIDCVRQCTDGVSGTISARHQLRKCVAERITAIAQAGVSWNSKVNR